MTGIYDRHVFKMRDYTADDIDGRGLDCDSEGDMLNDYAALLRTAGCSACELALRVAVAHPRNAYQQAERDYFFHNPTLDGQS